MMRQVSAMAPRSAAGALLLGLLTCGCQAERAWMQAERAMPAAAASITGWLGGGAKAQNKTEDQKAESAGGALGPVLQHLQRNGLQRQSSSIGIHPAASGKDPSEEKRFVEHLHASGPPPDLEKAGERLDPAKSTANGEPVTEGDKALKRLDAEESSEAGGQPVTEAAPLPDDFVDACSMKGEPDPKQVLAKLHGCTEALDRFAEEAKSAHGRSREANAQYVQKFKQVMEDLLALKDMKNFHEAFDKDDEAALKVLLGEATKSKGEIDALAPSP